MGLCAGAALYFGGGDSDTVSFLQLMVSWHGLTVDSDQIVLWFAVKHLLVEELLDCHVTSNVNMIGESAAVVVYVQDSHGVFLSV
jgi:hypothetical protein